MEDRPRNCSLALASPLLECPLHLTRGFGCIVARHPIFLRPTDGQTTERHTRVHKRVSGSGHSTGMGKARTHSHGVCAQIPELANKRLVSTALRVTGLLLPFISMDYLASPNNRKLSFFFARGSWIYYVYEWRRFS